MPISLPPGSFLAGAHRLQIAERWWRGRVRLPRCRHHPGLRELHGAHLNLVQECLARALGKLQLWKVGTDLSGPPIRGRRL